MFYACISLPPVLTLPLVYHSIAATSSPAHHSLSRPCFVCLMSRVCNRHEQHASHESFHVRVCVREPID